MKMMKMMKMMNPALSGSLSYLFHCMKIEATITKMKIEETITKMKIEETITKIYKMSSLQFATVSIVLISVQAI